MRPRTTLVAIAAAIAIGGITLAPAAVIKPDAPDAPDGRGVFGAAEDTAAAPPEPSPPSLAPGPVSVKVDGFFSWALLDRDTGKITGSRNITATNSTESMIKVWVVADYLRGLSDRDQRPSAARLKQASAAIRDSDDRSTQSLYVMRGRDSVVRRMISTCGLTDTRLVPGWWSRTQISARDAVRLGACVADGRAAGPMWTPWLLEEMRQVRGTTAKKDQKATSGGGRWGIVDGLPQEILDQGVGIKNGWTPIWADGSWHLNCLAVAPDWVLAVLMRYPVKRGLDYGAEVCASVARQLVHRSPAPSPDQR